MKRERNRQRQKSKEGQERSKHGQHKEFWNTEYQTGEHLALSAEPSEDLVKFCRWLLREYGKDFFVRSNGARGGSHQANVLDIGCGNGRNLIFMARELGCRGVGYDISEEAIKQAREVAEKENLPVRFEVRSLSETVPAENESADIVLDMMSSHFLKAGEREALRAEVLRVLKLGGFLFFKSFLADGDLHVKRLLRDYPTEEADSYIHPKLGVLEHVWTEESLRTFFEPSFDIHKLDRSHKHLLHGKAWKRRTVAAYLEKRW